MKIKKYAKSPMNYTGGKYKILGDIIPLFPKRINNFIDLFAGGLDVSINTDAKNIYCNDINVYLMEIYETISVCDIEWILSYIVSKIDEFELSKQNREGFIAFREHYNKTRIPLDLFVLTCFSFNHQIRFNNSFEYNNPFGKDRSSYNGNIEKNLIKFKKLVDGFTFSSMSFDNYDFDFLGADDFVYLDPPYIISKASYNDGSRGFGGWSNADELSLYSICDNLTDNGVKFAMSNVLKHKGLENTTLIDWARKYNIINIEHNYKNSSYKGNNTDKETTEVIIKNY